MSSTLKMRGFSLPEVLISMMLLVMVITTTSAVQSRVSQGLAQLAQYRQLWRVAWNAAGPQPLTLPAGWQMRRVQTLQQRCVSITVTIVAPSGREARLSRLHCPPR
ncbi:prepilin-type N-terminal cleavage/methylation domain-containing protein [Pluralibacter gergoviae]